MQLAGRHALVTGGSSGIGLAVARSLAQEGCHVHLVARRASLLDEACRAVTDACRGAERIVTAHVCDVAREADVHAVFEELRSAGHAPSVVVSSAGVSSTGYFEQIPLPEFEQTMRVNYFGTLFVAREAVRDMLSAGEGILVNVSSLAGLMGVFGYSAYAASKFAVSGLTHTLRSELAPHGIQVVLLCPPDTDTPMLAQEAATKPRETFALAESAGVLGADAVAAELLRAIRRRRAVVIPGAGSKFVALASRLAPGLVDRLVDAKIRRVRREMAKT